MNLFEYLSESGKRQQRERERILAFLMGNWLRFVAFALACAGVVLIAQASHSKRVHTTGHMWWKHTTTSDVPLGTRIVHLLLGLLFIAAAVLCVLIAMRQAAKRSRRRKYVAILKGTESLPIQQIAEITGSPAPQVYRDLQLLIESDEIPDYYLDFERRQVVSKRYIPERSHKTVVTCTGCGANNELIVGITKPCGSCGEPLTLRSN